MRTTSTRAIHTAATPPSRDTSMCRRVPKEKKPSIRMVFTKKPKALNAKRAAQMPAKIFSTRSRVCALELPPEGGG